MVTALLLCYMLPDQSTHVPEHGAEDATSATQSLSFLCCLDFSVSIPGTVPIVDAIVITPTLELLNFSHPPPAGSGDIIR